MKARIAVLLLLLFFAGCSGSEEIPDEVYDLRQLGVNVLGMDIGYSDILVLYEPISGEQEMIFDIGLIAGYLYELHQFDDLEVQVELDEIQIFTVTIEGDDVEDYENGVLDVGEFRQRWVIS